MMAGLAPALVAAALAIAAPAARAADPDTCPPTAQPALALPRFADAATSPAGVRIITFGSSSTAGAGASEPRRAYPPQLEERLGRALAGVSVTVVNRGASGEDVTHMLARIDTEVLARSPDLVVWQVGANAALRRMDPERFRQNLRTGLERLRGAGVDVVLLDNQRAPAIVAQPGHRDYDGILAEVAAAVPGVRLFSRGALMEAWAEAGVPPSALISPDGLHHNDRGYACLAEALAEALLAGLPERALAAR
ncbi:GDSL-type esterase/lipase family protein [Roseomonas sp. HF4]|uniref:SGNH/GDSL hydrolase family protein n=1 Tax=Roseomonas sp. HF4 TaxID=2562313 RepID=UPI0010C1424A|nr:GDSL-type esterase/lipase family protein [Roseomonas sp. HF4]